MLGLSLTNNLRDILNEVGSFSLDEQQKAAMRALNRAAQGAITDASKQIRGRYRNLKKRDVDSAFSISQASSGNLKAVVTVRGRPLSLARFLAGQITQRGKGGVWVNVRGERKFIPHAWAQTMKDSQGNDYIVIMVREGKDRYPVKVLKTIDIPGAFSVPEVIDYVEQQSEIRFESALVNSLNFLESKR